MQANHSVILIHPAACNPAAVLAPLSDGAFVPMHVMSYEDRVGMPHDDSYGLLFVTGESCRKNMKGAEKSSNWKEIELIPGRSIPRMQAGFYI